jgi:hypothetical protein
VRKLSGSRCSRAQQFELEHDFHGALEVAKVAVYRKALFRDRNQTIKRTLFTLEPRPDALRGVFQPLNRRKFTLNALNCPIWVSLEPDNSDTFVSLPLIESLVVEGFLDHSRQAYEHAIAFAAVGSHACVGSQPPDTPRWNTYNPIG